MYIGEAEVEFEWDPRKDRSNRKKHGVSFDEATTAFFDEEQTRAMRAEYDFSGGRKNPYAKRLKKRVTIRLDVQTIDYFKALSAESGIPYQTLINLYLRDCAASKREMSLEWRKTAGTG